MTCNLTDYTDAALPNLGGSSLPSTKYIAEYVVGFAFNQSNILLIEKTKPSWQKGLLNGIGGLVESGEGLRDAMYREFKEETSLVTDWQSWTNRVRLTAFSGGKRGCSECLVNFFNIHLSDEQRSKTYTTTREKLFWVPFDSLYDLVVCGRIVQNLLWLIPLCLDANLDQRTLVLVQDRK